MNNFLSWLRANETRVYLAASGFIGAANMAGHWQQWYVGAGLVALATLAGLTNDRSAKASEERKAAKLKMKGVQ
jgi:hypothetical protein